MIIQRYRQISENVQSDIRKALFVCSADQ